MLKTLLLSLSLMAASFGANAQWTLSQRITTKQYNDIIFSTADTLFAAGANGNLTMSTDTGTTWRALNIGSSEQIMALASPASKVLFAVGGENQGKIFKSNDAGQTWQTTTFPNTRFLIDITFITDSIGVAVGWNGLIVKTTDGGQNWFVTDPGVTDNFYSVHFPVPDTGYAVGINNTIVKTTNGGNSWLSLNHSIFQGILLDVFFLSADTGFVVGGYGLMYKTNNGGLTWSPVFHGHGNYLQDIQFISHQEGYAVGALGTIMHTTDKGATWSTDTFGYFNRIIEYGWYGIATFGDKVLFAGYNGKIARPGCMTAPGIEQITSCSPIVWRDSPYYDESNWSSTFMLPGAGINGCDSLLLLDYIRPLPIPAVTFRNDTLLALSPFSSFQWVNCDSNFATIPGAINRYFVPQASGSYAVILTNQAGCVDTSSCIFMKIISEEEHAISQVEIYPNPSRGYFNLKLNGLKAEEMHIYSSTGQKVFQSEQVHEGTYDLPFESGIYFVQIQVEGHAKVFRWVVE